MLQYLSSGSQKTAETMAEFREKEGMIYEKS